MGAVAETSALTGKKDKDGKLSCPERRVEKCPSGFCKCYCKAEFFEMPNPANPKLTMCVEPDSPVAVAYKRVAAATAKRKKTKLEAEDDETVLIGKYTGGAKMKMVGVNLKDTEKDGSKQDGDTDFQGEQSTTKLKDG